MDYEIIPVFVTDLELTDQNSSLSLDGMLGLVIDGLTRVGYYLRPLCSPTRAVASTGQGPIFQPAGEPTGFSFDYDPRANDGVGRITLLLGDKTHILNLTPRQRAQAVTFDHFGLASMRLGGKYVSIYFDDLAYTARGEADRQPVRTEQQYNIVPYPRRGREY